MEPSIYIRIDQPPVGSQFKFDVQLCLGDDDKGEATTFRSKLFDKDDEHDTFVAMMQHATTLLLQARDFKKKATVENLHLLNAQGQPVDEKPLIVIP